MLRWVLLLLMLLLQLMLMLMLMLMSFLPLIPKGVTPKGNNWQLRTGNSVADIPTRHQSG